MNELLFIVEDKIGNRENTVYLLNDAWDDWFQYSTQYVVYYVDMKGYQKRIGFVKIAEQNQTERRAILPTSFTELGEDFFSLGASEDYYLGLKENLSLEMMEHILKALNDIAFNLQLYEQVKRQNVTQISLKRDVTETLIKGQFYRIAHGGARLTKYSFEYSFPLICGGANKAIDFEVIPDSKPPTNIHAIIGKNGVGKTSLLKRMLYMEKTIRKNMEDSIE